MRWRGLVIGMLIFILAGCQKVELYANLSEKDANKMLVILLSNHIPATKTRTKEFIQIWVPKEDVAVAVQILTRYGFPRDPFTDLGQIFQKQGLISSPLEERVRYTYGLSQMIGETLSQIDGVLSARVLIVLPESLQFGKTTNPSSASVFLKYLPGAGVEDAIPRIKMIVQNSVDGLQYDNIAVVLFPVPESMQQPLPVAVSDQATPGSLWLMLAAVLGGLLILALGGNGYLFWRMRRMQRDQGKALHG